MAVFCWALWPLLHGRHLRDGGHSSVGVKGERQPREHRAGHWMRQLTRQHLLHHRLLKQRSKKICHSLDRKPIIVFSKHFIFFSSIFPKMNCKWIYLVEIWMWFSVHHSMMTHSTQHWCDHWIGHHKGILWKTQRQSDSWSERPDLWGGGGDRRGHLTFAVSMGWRWCLGVAIFMFLGRTEKFLHFFNFESPGFGQIERDFLIQGATPAVGGGGGGWAPLSEVGWGLRSWGAMVVRGENWRQLLWSTVHTDGGWAFGWCMGDIVFTARDWKTK